MTQPPAAPWTDRLVRAAPYLIALAAVLVYANSLWNDFAYDDVFIVRQNARVHDLANLRAIWLTPYWPEGGAILGLYRPLTIFAFAVQWAIVGDAPWLFHLTNVLLHAGVCVVGFHVLAELTSRAAAFAGALVFAVHPVHTEAVANVVGQAELVAALCVIAACLVWLRRPVSGPVGLGRSAALAGLYLLGMLAKEHAIVLPGLLLALDVATGRTGLGGFRGLDSTSTPEEAPGGTGSGRGRFVPYLAAALRPVAWMFVVSLAYLALRLHVLGTLAGTDPGPSLPYLREDARLFTALRAWPEFARLMIWPFDLSADYSPGVVLPAVSVTPMIALGFVLLAGTVLLAVLTARLPRAGLPAAWFLVAILPASNLLFPIGVLLAERTLYLPSFAVALAVAFAFSALATAAPSPGSALRPIVPAALLLAAMIAAMSVRTIQRNPDWDDLGSVMVALLRDHPESYRAQWSAAVNVDSERAKAEHWTLAYAMWPRDPQMLTEFGFYHISRNRPSRGADLLLTAQRLAPELPRATMLLPSALLAADRPREALAALADAYRMAGPDSRLYEVQARTHARLGQHDRAAGAWAAVIHAFRGGNAEQWRLLAVELAAAGRSERAAAALDSATARLRDALDPQTQASVAPLPASLPPEAMRDSIAETRRRLGL